VIDHFASAAWGYHRPVGWEGRWRELVLAGGAVFVTACNTSSCGQCCNANSDPCCQEKFCGKPMTESCKQEVACEAEGGVFDWNNAYVDGAWVTACLSLSEAGLAGSGDDAGPDSDAGGE
jgi:hypothetical protein